MGIVKKKAQVIKKAEKIFTPTQNRIFSMDKDILLSHNILIDMKQSSLSAEERRLVSKRVEWGIANGKITRQDINEAISRMHKFLLGEE